MLLGGSVTGAYNGAKSWALTARRLGFAAAACPIDCTSSAEDRRELLLEAEAAGVMLAEVGVWRNCMAPDERERADNIAYAKRQLALAEEMGIACCVNVSGARGPQWDGAYAANYSEDACALLVDTVREIIDAVKPARAFYTLEPMPWMLPDSTDSYLRLIRDVNRGRFAVHMDFANLINCPERFLFHRRFIEDFVVRLAPFTKSVHIKDVRMDPHAMPLHLQECAPGHGQLDWGFVLKLLDRHLPSGMPVLLEHMSRAEEYAEAMRYISGVAAQNKVPVR